MQNIMKVISTVHKEETYDMTGKDMQLPGTRKIDERVILSIKCAFLPGATK